MHLRPTCYLVSSLFYLKHFFWDSVLSLFMDIVLNSKGTLLPRPLRNPCLPYLFCPTTNKPPLKGRVFNQFIFCLPQYPTRGSDVYGVYNSYFSDETEWTINSFLGSPDDFSRKDHLVSSMACPRPLGQLFYRGDGFIGMKREAKQYLSVRTDSKGSIPRATKLCILTRPYAWDRSPCPGFCGFMTTNFKLKCQEFYLVSDNRMWWSRRIQSLNTHQGNI